MSLVPLLGAHAQPGVLLAAHMLLADRCNHACVHCYQVHGLKGEMSFGEIVAILDELKRAGVLFVGFSGGEVSLRPDLIEILEAARARDFGIILHTNGFDLSKELEDAIARVGVWSVRISLYSTIAREHDEVTAVPGSFERTVACVKRLRARSIQVMIVTTMTSHTSVGGPEIEAFASSMGCSFQGAVLVTAREDGSLASLGATADRAQLVDYFRACGAQTTSHAERLHEAPCGACTSSLTILANGSIRPCTHIPHELGQAAGAESIADIVASDAFQLITSVRWSDIHGCRDCALLPVCDRCHGSAAFETGDILGPQPSACRVALARHEAETGTSGAPAAGYGRPAGVGPFRLVDGALRCAPDRKTAADEALATRFAWLRPSPSQVAELAGIVPAGNLLKKRAVARPHLANPRPNRATDAKGAL